MQDLGRIVIDINEQGSAKAEGISGIANMGQSGGSASSAMEELGMSAESVGAFAELSVAASAIAGVFAVISNAVVKTTKALMELNTFVLQMANELREYSPGIQLAEMQNQIAMVNTKFRMGMQYGGAIGAQMLEVGRIDRSLLELKSAAAGIGAVFLKPITKMIADITEMLRDNIPKMIQFFASLSDAMATYSEFMMRLFVGLSQIFMGVSPGLGAMFLGGNIVWAKLMQMFTQMGIDLRAIKNNTDPRIDYGALNEPFLQDLRLMGVKGI
jgi:phage-related tail protein